MLLKLHETLKIWGETERRNATLSWCQHFEIGHGLGLVLPWSYLMQRRQTVNVCRVDVSTAFDEPFDFIFVRGRTSGQEDTAISELNPLRLAFGFIGFGIGFTFLPPFELFGPFEKGRRVAVLQGSHPGNMISRLQCLQMFFSWHNPKEKDESEVRVCTARRRRPTFYSRKGMDWRKRDTYFGAHFAVNFTEFS